MKKIYLFILIVLTFLSSVNASAQSRASKEYVPTITWPFLFDDFYDGIILVGNDTVSHAKVNFHLRAEKLFCVNNDGKVMRVTFANMNGVIINKRVYRFVEGKLMLQIHEEDDAMLVRYKFLDYDLFDNGYMQGLALYARENFDVSLRANWNNHLDYKNIHMPGEFNEDYLTLFNNRSSAQELPVKDRYYFIINGKAIPATKSGCSELLDKDGRKKLNDFLKSHNLKWKTANDLVTILRFMKQQ